MTYPLAHTPLPVTAEIDDLGLRLLKGVLFAENDLLKLEYKIEDSIVGLIKSELYEFEFTFDDIRTVEYKKKLIGARLIIHGKSMKTFTDVHGAEQTRLEFKIKRADRKTAQDIASQVNLLLSEHRLNALEENNS